MKQVPIPPASLERLRVLYAQFEQLATVVSEAMGIPPTAVKQISLPNGVFVVEDDAESTNGVAALAAEEQVPTA